MLEQHPWRVGQAIHFLATQIRSEISNHIVKLGVRSAAFEEGEQVFSKRFVVLVFHHALNRRGIGRAAVLGLSS